ANSRAELTGAPDNSLHTSDHIIQSALSAVANAHAQFSGSPDNTLSNSSHCIAASLNTICFQQNRMVCQ
ncbi:hypothetical protein, partial [Pseudoalteromonas sp. MMG012]|uniref:hypothetical protein n=1 Tax=Pseudoalteromonas sp. MMG012 TaxID=2822686 RepID=UPI001B3A3BA1